MVPSVDVLLLLLLGSLSVVFWIDTIRRIVERGRALDYRQRRPVAWGLIDLLGVVFFFVAIQIAAVLLLESVAGVKLAPSLEGATTSDTLWMIGMLIVASSVAFVVGLLLIVLRTGARPDDFGLRADRWLNDIGLGAKAFVMIDPPIYFLQVILSQFFPKEHPLNELMRKDSDPWLFLICGLMVTVVAPVTEEFFFRGLLQGWLENLAWYRRYRREIAVDSATAWRLLFGGRSSREEMEAVGRAGDSPVSESISVEPFAVPADRGGENPFVSPALPATDGDPQATIPEPVEFPIVLRPTWWPTVLSALLFSLAHLGQGPAPIPLFFFALGLGYLYRQTHGVVAPITAHFLLNATTMVMLYLTL